MSNPSPKLEILGELGEWEVTLHSGEIIKIAAQGYSESEQTFDFTLLIDGTPRYLLSIVQIPRDLVSDILGG